MWWDEMEWEVYTVKLNKAALQFFIEIVTTCFNSLVYLRQEHFRICLVISPLPPGHRSRQILCTFIKTFESHLLLTFEINIKDFHGYLHQVSEHKKTLLLDAINKDKTLLIFHGEQRIELMLRTSSNFFGPSWNTKWDWWAKNELFLIA